MKRDGLDIDRFGRKEVDNKAGPTVTRATSEGKFSSSGQSIGNVPSRGQPIATNNHGWNFPHLGLVVVGRDTACRLLTNLVLDQELDTLDRGSSGLGDSGGDTTHWESVSIDDCDDVDAPGKF